MAMGIQRPPPRLRRLQKWEIAALPNIERKMEDKFEKGVERGMDLGCEEGYIVAKEGFDSLLEKIKAREAQETTSSADSCTQTDPSPTTTTVSTGTVGRDRQIT